MPVSPSSLLRAEYDRGYADAQAGREPVSTSTAYDLGYEWYSRQNEPEGQGDPIFARIFAGLDPSSGSMYSALEAHRPPGQRWADLELDRRFEVTEDSIVEERIVVDVPEPSQPSEPSPSVWWERLDES